MAYISFISISGSPVVWSCLTSCDSMRMESGSVVGSDGAGMGCMSERERHCLCVDAYVIDFE